MLETHVIIIISLLSFVASFFGSLAGGGGLLILPAMLAFGLPVPFALGTRRFSTVGTMTSGLIQFYRWKKIDYRFSASLVVFTLSGAGIGYLIVDSVNELILKRTIGFFIIALSVFLFFEDADKVKAIKGKLYAFRYTSGRRG